MENEINTDKVYDSAIKLWGMPAQIDIFMEECGELATATNKYFNRTSVTSDKLATEVADVEICLGQIKRMIGTAKFDNLILTIDDSKINFTPTKVMAICGKCMDSVFLYFMGEGYIEDDLVSDLVNLYMACSDIRNKIGNEIVDSHRQMKLIRLQNRIKQYLNDE